MLNDIATLMKFFSTPEKPVNLWEYMEFRRSLTDNEKIYYAFIELPK